jgi:hypothetical protein
MAMPPMGGQETTMSTRHPFRVARATLLPIVAGVIAVGASVALIEHDVQRHAHAATIEASVKAQAAPTAPERSSGAQPEATVEDLELVGRSIANYDR